MLSIALIGCGAIGESLLKSIRYDNHLQVAAIVVSKRSIDRVARLAETLAPGASVTENIPDSGINLVVEAAGHHAIEAHVLPALKRGISAVIASVGALAMDDLAPRLETAATSGRSQVHLIAGAVGAIDAIAAAKIGGLDKVLYTGKKPALAWQGTPAELQFNLATLTEATVVFEGSARDAAQRFPKNANVAATIALASLGLDATTVRLIADPKVSTNIHTIDASGAFGELNLTLHNRPLSDNPKTSALTVYSMVRTLQNLSGTLVI